VGFFLKSPAERGSPIAIGLPIVNKKPETDDNRFVGPVSIALLACSLNLRGWLRSGLQKRLASEDS
jgi:hypothetical protein